MRVLFFHTHSVWSVAWSPDGKVVTGRVDKTVKIWVVDSTGTFKCESTLTGHSNVRSAIHSNKTCASSQSQLSCPYHSKCNFPHQ